MKGEILTKLIYYPILAILAAVRKPVFWIILMILLGLWWFQNRQEEVATEQSEELLGETLQQMPSVPTTTGPIPLPNVAAFNGQAGKTNELQEFTFPPDFTEAVVGRFRIKEGRMPKDWDEFVTAGVSTNLPPAPAGFKYVYNSQLGLLEMLRVKPVAQ